MNRLSNSLLLLFLLYLAPTTAGAQQSSAVTNTTDPAYYLKSVLHYGGAYSWTTAVQSQALSTYLNTSSPEQQTALCMLLATANTDAAKVFALKSFLTGDRDPAIIKAFISRLNALPENEQKQECLVFQPKGWMQKWQYSCSISVVVCYLMELSPRYAFEMKQIKGWDSPSCDATSTTAQEEKRILEQYGGGASPRGNTFGKSIGILDPLNDMVGKLLGVRFRAEPITGTTDAGLGQIRTLLQTGMNVPVLIDLLPSQTPHFILFFRTKQEAGKWQYLVYDPWEGKCDWVAESTIIGGSLAPLLAEYSARLTYYYPFTPL